MMWDLEDFVDYDYLNIQDSKENRIIVRWISISNFKYLESSKRSFQIYFTSLFAPSLRERDERV